MEQAVDRVTNATIKSPENVGKVINEEKAKIVQQKTVDIPAATSKQAEQVAKQLSRELANVKSARLKVDQLVNTGVSNLITQLSSSNEDVRIRASDKLSNRGEKLTKSQVNRVINIMRNGQQEWSKFLYRGGHCTYYENTSIKYYAANSILDMNSKYINNEIRNQARSATYDGKRKVRVDDPGWI